jgi:hypothetical protein
MVSLNQKINVLDNKFQIKQWISKKVIKKIGIDNFSNFLRLEDPNEGYAHHGIVAVNEKPKNGEKYYGKNFPMITDIQLTLLRDCKTATDQGKGNKLMEFGPGWGFLVWKELVAGCIVHVVDESFKYNKPSETFDTVIKSRVPIDILDNLTKISLDLFKLPATYPEFLGSFNIVSAHNVLHMFGPKSSEEFVKIAYNLLQPKGKIYITVNSFALQMSDKNCMNVYNHNKENGAAFPAFIYSEIKANHDFSKIYSNECYFNNSVNIYDQEPTNLDIVYNNYSTRSGFSNLFDQETLINLFTRNGFNVLDCYYMDLANRVGDFSNSKFVAIIVEKPEFFEEEVNIVGLQNYELESNK